MKLYYSQNSPYARRARMALRVTGLIEHTDEIDVHPRDENLDTLLAAGPGGKVPVLTTDAGVSLCESLVISHYLDSLSPGVLYPTENTLLSEVLGIESTASVLMDSLFTRSRENRRVPNEQSPDVINLEKERAARLYLALEKTAPILKPANSMDMATITTVAALDYANWRHADDEWINACPALASWFKAISENEVCEQTRPVY